MGLFLFHWFPESRGLNRSLIDCKSLMGFVVPELPDMRIRISARWIEAYQF